MNAVDLEKAITESGERMLPYFRFGHLPAPLQLYSEPFAGVALAIVDMLPGSAERTVCLRKLLEAKDCAVRAALDK